MLSKTRVVRSPKARNWLLALNESEGSPRLSIQNECGLTISLLIQSKARGLKLQPAVETQHYERAWPKAS
jgi:hypothetical protein